MSLLLETTIGDVTIDLDLEGSPNLCYNALKLAKARYYTGSLLYNVQPGRFFQTGDPRGDGTGGTSIYGLIDVTHTSEGKDKKVTDVVQSTKRFIKSDGRALSKSQMKEKGRVIAIEMDGIANTVGSQFIITTDAGEGKALDELSSINVGLESKAADTETKEQKFLSLGTVVEDDDDVLEKMNTMYCDKHGRPYVDVRIIRVHILDDPYDDPPDMPDVLKERSISLIHATDLPEKYQVCARWLSSASPDHKRPPDEVVETRISASEAFGEEDEETEKRNQMKRVQKEDKSRAVVLEMLGDLPSADIKPPENVLFVCKLNSVTDDEDLELIFSRFDSAPISAEIIRDPETGDSLQYAFIEFSTKEACNEAYFKMNGALIDDRRIKVDFSQSVAKEWNKFRRQKQGTNTQTRKRTHQQISNKDHRRGQRSSYNERPNDRREQDRHNRRRDEPSGETNVRRRADERRGRHHQDHDRNRDFEDTNRNNGRDHRDQRRNASRDHDRYSHRDNVRSERRHKYDSYGKDTDSEESLVERNERDHRERRREKSRDERRKRSRSYDEKDYSDNRHRSRRHSSKKHSKKSSRSHR